MTLDKACLVCLSMDMKFSDDSKEGTMSLTITPLHEERCRQINSVVQHDIVKRGLTFEQSVESLSKYLGLDTETIMLCIGVVNDLDSDNPHTRVV